MFGSQNPLSFCSVEGEILVESCCLDAEFSTKIVWFGLHRQFWPFLCPFTTSNAMKFYQQADNTLPDLTVCSNFDLTLWMLPHTKIAILVGLLWFCPGLPCPVDLMLLWFLWPQFLFWLNLFALLVLVCSMCPMRFWWFCPVFVNACACKLFNKLRESLTFFRIAIRTLVQAGANVGK